MALIIFDLDGTLIDSRLDLAHAVNATRAHMELSPIEHEIIFSYVGNGAPVLIKRAMGEDAGDEDVAEALKFFLAYYREHCVDYTVLYPGVMESLVSLHEAGHQLAVLTNKPVRISEMIMDHFGLTPMLLRTYGGNSFEHKKPHPIGIETLMSEAGTSKEDTWMVGDSYVDIETAANAGVPSCGVTFGFRPDTLASPVPTLLVDSMEEFADHVLRTQAAT